MPGGFRRAAGRPLAVLVAAGVLVAGCGLGVAEAAPRLSRASAGAAAEIVVLVGLDGQLPAFNLDGVQVGGAGGTLTLGTDGSATASGDVALGAPSAVRPPVKLSAPQRGVMAVSLSRRVTLAGPRGTIAVDGFASDAPGAGVLWTGSRDIRVGARLVLPGGLPPGTYTGSYELTLENN